MSTHSEIYLDDSQKQFVQKIIKSAVTANAEVLKQQQTLLRLHKQFMNKSFLPMHALSRLSSIAAEYSVTLDLTKPNILNNLQIWEQLHSRIDTVPFSLILAQAIYESNWGKSRFAREGQNYFGERCFDIGCGIIPHQRNENDIFEMRQFDSMTDSIRSYIHNLNSNKNYERFRFLRNNARLKNIKLDGFMLAEALKEYAEQQAYSKAIQSIIQKYDLVFYDKEPPQEVLDLSSVEMHSFNSLIRYNDDLYPF